MDIQRVIFLDIDGVVNSFAWLSCPGPPRGLPRARIAERVRQRARYCHLPRAELEYELERLDPRALKRVARLAQQTQSHIVISSSWRTVIDFRGLEEIFIGLTSWPRGLIRDQTPIFNTLFERGREISAWLAEHPCDNYVILDDLPPQAFPGHKQRLVQTDMTYGLEERHCRQARLLLDQATTE